MSIFLIVIFGLLIGSFLNVCIYRIPANKSIVFPGSHCPDCQKRIPFYLNIPVLSYALLAGKCKYCKKPLSFQYPLVELLGAVLPLLIYLKFGFSGTFLFYSVFSFFLIVIAFIDINTRLILNKVLVIMLVSGIFLNGFLNVIPWLESLYGFLTGGGSIFLFALLGKFLFKKESMGMGDVKFAAVAGFFVGWKIILVALYMGFFIALFLIVILKMIRLLPKIEYIPMGPFFSAGIVVFILWGETIANYYLKMFI